jgi:pimeloyl-ACP methyl ester carboxylesterase
MTPRYFDLPWGRLAYEMDGETGPCFLFLHGTGCDNRDWDGVRALLPAHGLLLVFLEFRGHGASSVSTTDFTLDDLADDALALLAHLGIPRASFVGHSLGGMVALAAARKQPTAIEGLVLLEGWTVLRAAGAFGSNRFYGNLGPEAIELIKAKDMVTRARHPVEQWSNFWDTVKAFDGSDVLADPPAPVWEVYGEMGRLPDTESRLLVPPHPRLAWRWLPDCGHYIPLEKPAEIATLCWEMAGR